MSRRFNRLTQDFLPYTLAGDAAGGFRSAYFSEQPVFYTSAVTNKVADDSVPYRISRHKKEIVSSIVAEEKISHARASRIISLDRSMFYYRGHPRDNSEVEEKLGELATILPTRGFDEYFKRLRDEGKEWNHKRVKKII